MAKSIRDLTPIADGDHHVEPDTLFEGVTQFTDGAGIYARKIRTDELETYMTRNGGEIKAFIDAQVGVEKDRAETAERNEKDRAQAAEAMLDRNKANKYVHFGPGRLMDAAVGVNIDKVSFNLAVHPVLVDSYIQCPGGVFRVENNEFFFQPVTGSRVVFYTGGEWTSAATGVFEAPGLTVEINHNANGGVWENHYGCYLVDLEEAREVLHGEIASERLRAEQEEDTIKAAIPGAVSTAVAAHNTSVSAHPDIRNAIPALPSAPTNDGKYELVVASGSASWAIPALPSAPTQDGEYKLVVASGSASWQVIS